MYPHFCTSLFYSGLPPAIIWCTHLLSLLGLRTRDPLFPFMHPTFSFGFMCPQFAVGFAPITLGLRMCYPFVLGFMHPTFSLGLCTLNLLFGLHTLSLAWFTTHYLFGVTTIYWVYTPITLTWDCAPNIYLEICTIYFCRVYAFWVF
jgi:hypothetical protein